MADLVRMYLLEEYKKAELEGRLIYTHHED
jgi:hypothetical protein